MTTRKINGILLLAFLVLVFSGCENGYVQELLYGPSTLKNLTIIADDQQAYGLKPYFSNTRFAYEATVPVATSSINVEAFANLDGNITYSFGDGVIFTQTSASGHFDFPPEMESAVVKIRVSRPKMAETTYTLTVIRADMLLGGITVQGGASLDEIDPKCLLLSPGFLPDTYHYTVRVYENVQALRVAGLVNPEKAHAYYNLDTRVPDSASCPPGDPRCIKFDFPASTESRTVWIQVRPLDLNGNEKTDEWKNSEVTINRNKKVSLDSTIWNAYHCDRMFRFEIDGLPSDYAAGNPPVKSFGPGEPVVFTLLPPFGYRINGNIEIIHDLGGPNELVDTKPLSPSNRYVFLMFMEHVTIRVNFRPFNSVPNVRYVWEHGTGDGSSWANAACDIQALIDNYNKTPGNPDNYEIWIAKGNYTPDWTNLSDAALAGWAKKITPSMRQIGSEIYWSFVLTDGVKIFGGFSGREETLADKEKRDIKANETALSGDINDNKIFRIMTAAGIPDAYVEGLTLYGSFNPLVYPDALCINGIEPWNFCGGLLYVENANPLFKNVTFRYGQADSGGGVGVIGNCCPVFINCNFDHNQGIGSGGGADPGMGSAVTLMAPSMSFVIPHLVMIGGAFTGNMNSGGVINLEYGNAALVNVSITDNLEHAINAVPSYKILNPKPSENVFINLTVTGNRGALSDSPYTVSGIAASLYNSVVRDNRAVSNAVGKTGNVDPDTMAVNTIAPNHPDDIGDHGNYTDRGDNAYYPINTDGTWNTLSPAYNYLHTPNRLSSTVLEEIRIALLKDGSGNPRFHGSSIDLGAQEK
jgi:hypothetical protein